MTAWKDAARSQRTSMKIGVLTLWTSKDNYGQLLQGWALQWYLRSMGNDAYIIRYAYRPGSRARARLKGTAPYRALRSICNRTMPSRRPQLEVELLEKRTAARRFDEFRRDALTFSSRAYNSLSELRASPPEAELYITGSDQVWGISLEDAEAPARYLAFGDDATIRVSYAAGVSDEFADDQLPRLGEFLGKLDAIGVREESTKLACTSAGYRAEVTLDPTLLLRPQTYLELVGDAAPVAEGSYLFAYVLNVAQPEDVYWPQLAGYCQARSMPIAAVYSSGYTMATQLLPGVSSFEATVPQWLQSIRVASRVVTTSFHGVVFCILFHRQFLAVPLVGEHTFANNRLLTLLGSLGLMGRLYQGGDFAAQMDAPINWPQVDGRLDVLRQDSEAFLKDALDMARAKSEGTSAHA